ncbi:hypothetical protein F2Q70_00043051 [Brassica cretica]|uniref:Uncharacterized protein n=1 Tax=Brassica cretica TaxID=69181 RepID=A0A8S9KEQ2_BRACR|nr:hypothetical protein F2Q70_00043051 [Brassica cretica]
MEYQFLIRFLPSTRLGEVHTDAPVIKSERFMMRRYDQLQVLANTNLGLPNVVGEIRSVQGSDLSNDSATTRVVVRFLIEPNVIVYLTLWDEAASTFRGLLKSGDKSKAVINPEWGSGGFDYDTVDCPVLVMDSFVGFRPKFGFASDRLRRKIPPSRETIERIRVSHLLPSVKSESLTNNGD